LAGRSVHPVIERDIARWSTERTDVYEFVPTVLLFVLPTLLQFFLFLSGLLFPGSQPNRDRQPSE
jgi:hypothetical protein